MKRDAAEVAARCNGTGPRASTQTMSEARQGSQPTTENVSDTTLERAGVFGIDSSGSSHRWDSINKRVIVETDGDVEHVERMSRENVSEWIAYVADERGWTGTWWTCKSFAEALEARQQAEEEVA